MILLLDLYDNATCQGSCLDRIRGFIKPESQYINYYQGRGKKWDCALVDLKGGRYEEYVKRQKYMYKGNIFRQARKAERLGYYCNQVAYKLFIPDVVEINHSKETRQRGPMKGHYNQSVEEKGGFPKTHYLFSWPKCQRHYSIFWGCFLKQAGHKQGDVVVDEKLVGYISLNRVGNVAMYSMILGHGDHLGHGIMYLLHLTILQWLLAQENPYTHEIEYLMYTAMQSGTEGLQQWKRVCLFEPHQLYYNGRFSKWQK